MPLMGSLYIGQSGLQTSQNALNTTAHNMSNLDTTGYTRQQILLSDKQYNTLAKSTSAVSYQQIGLGVTYSKVRQVRDDFLDKTYRRESGRSAFYSTSTTAMAEVQTVLGEMYGATFNDSLTNLKEALDELAKTPTDSVVQGLVVQRASEFIESGQAVYQGLSDYQDNLNLQAKSQVDKINKYGKEIQSLNAKIAKIETGGFESANDLRDARNQLLDELGAMASISYKTDNFGNVTVQIEGHDFVTRDQVFEIGMEQDELTGFYTPYWKIDGAEVYDLQQTVSSDLNTDIGSLKAILLARGDKRADYTDLSDKEHYDNDISQSILMNVQAELDQLIHEMTTKINGVLADAADTTTGYLCNAVVVNGTTTYCPIQLFEKKTTDGYTYGNYIDEDGTAQTGWIYNEEDATKGESLYSTLNLTVNADLVKEPTKLGFVKPDKNDDYTTTGALADTFKKEDLCLNPNVTSKAGFIDYYSNLVSQIANSGAVFQSISESQADTVEATCAAREQIIGVSSDEELTNMIRFQNAYNAASRYINVIDQMLEHIISSLT